MIKTPRILWLAALVGTMPSLAHAAAIFMIDIDSTQGGAALTTEPGWTSLDAETTNNVSVDGTTFTVFSADGSRNRSFANPLTRDFIFNEGAENSAVGLTVDNLPAGEYIASVWSFDSGAAVGDQIVGISDLNGTSGETIFTTDFASNPTDPFTFLFNTADFANGFAIFNRETTSGNRARFNALQLELIPTPEPATIAIWSLLGAIVLGYGWNLGRKTRA